MHIVAPEDGAQFFEHINQAEGQQHLVQVVAVVEVPKQQALDQQAKGHRQSGADHNGQRKAAQLRGQ